MDSKVIEALKAINEYCGENYCDECRIRCWCDTERCAVVPSDWDLYNFEEGEE